MKKNIFKILGIAGLALSISSCYKDKYEAMYPTLGIKSGGCDTNKTISYSSDIAPIMSNSCGSTQSGCHDAASASGGADLSVYSGVQQSALNGGLVGTSNWEVGWSQMPKGSSSKIDACDLAKITKWVNAGAPNN